MYAQGEQRGRCKYLINRYSRLANNVGGSHVRCVIGVSRCILMHIRSLFLIKVLYRVFLNFLLFCTYSSLPQNPLSSCHPWGVWKVRNRILCAPLCTIVIYSQYGRGRFNKVIWGFVTTKNRPFPHFWPQSHFIASSDTQIRRKVDLEGIVCAPVSNVIHFSGNILLFGIM